MQGMALDKFRHSCMCPCTCVSANMRKRFRILKFQKLLYGRALMGHDFRLIINFICRNQETLSFSPFESDYNKTV